MSESGLMERAVRVARAQGLVGLFAAAKTRLAPRRIKSHRRVLQRLAGGRGLEIGGPSALFDHLGLLPVYGVAGQIDNCNFGAETLWEGALSEGATFRYDRGRRLGQQFIAEATDLAPIADDSYDFVVSSHAIEHVANPLRALREWRRVLKTGGCLALFAPHRDGAFDHRRPLTTLDHLIDDFNRAVDERDLTHLEEILALHDLSRDPQAGSFEAFAARSRSNFQNRGMHHHVFDVALAADMVRTAGFEILAQDHYPPGDIFVFARKPEGLGPP